MVMVSNKDNTQELWLHDQLNKSVIEDIIKKIRLDKKYLENIKTCYSAYYQRIISTDYTQFIDKNNLLSCFKQWLKFILPLQAHYYAPMFIIDALSQLLLTHMQKIDAPAALADFQTLATYNVSSLADSLHKELRQLNKLSGHNYQDKLDQIVEDYGFLKCHQMYEAGYSKADFISMTQQLDDSTKLNSSKSIYTITKKYIQGHSEQEWLTHLNGWLNIRNQEMEYLMYAVLKSKPLFEALAAKMNRSVKEVWSLNTTSIIDYLKNDSDESNKTLQTNKTVIYYHNSKAQVRDDIKVLYPVRQSAKQQLHGKTIYGQGKLTAKIKTAFSPTVLDNFSANGENYVLVTGMTTPDFIPYLKDNFVGLITDEGGVLCHAAIIAREIPINAIVGTGLATELLADDMVVTVDFDRELVLLN